MIFSTASLFEECGLTFAITTVAIVPISVIVSTERELVGEFDLLRNEHSEH